MSKHTPGPWSLWEGYVFSTIVKVRIADCHVDVSRRISAHEMDCNARLIAAAPELLAACEAMLAELDQQHHGLGEQEILMRAAIAKAKP